MLSYAIKDGNSKTIHYEVISRKELTNGTLDKNLVRECIKDMKKFDLIITYYGTKFDLPFIRSRALYWGLEFPEYGHITHKDCYYMVRNKLCIHRNRLEDACQLIGITGKTHLNGVYWVKALTGDKKSLEYILEHNKADVQILEKLHIKLKEYVKDSNKSI